MEGEREREKRMRLKLASDLGYSIDLNVLHEFRIEKRETHKLRLIQVHHEQLVRGSQIRLLRGELLVEVAYVLAMFLRNETFNFSSLSPYIKILTIFGLNGGCTSRFSIFSQSIRRKNAWLRTSSSPRSPQPSLFTGFFVRNWKKTLKGSIYWSIGSLDLYFFIREVYTTLNLS